MLLTIPLAVECDNLLIKSANTCSPPDLQWSHKSLLWSLNDGNLSTMLQQVTHQTGVKLVSGWILGSLRSSRGFTEVHPVLAAGGQLAHLTEPRTESLETDLGTINKSISINILIQINCSFFNSFHVIWPSDSKPGAGCVSELDKWDTAFLFFKLYFSASSILYECIICRNYDFFLNSFRVMWPTDFWNRFCFHTKK